MDPTPIVNTTNFPAARFSNVGVLLNIITPLVTTGAVIVFLGMLLSGAFNMLTAGSDAEKVQKSRNTITQAILGLVIIISAYLIVRLVAFIFNIDVLPF